MASNQTQYDEQLRLLQEAFPQAPSEKITRLLKRHDGDIEQVRARLTQRAARTEKFNDLEARFGSSLADLQKEFPSAQSFKRHRLMRIMARCNGDPQQVQRFLKRLEERQKNKAENVNFSRREQREEIKTKYASQLGELSAAGINVNQPFILRLLGKHEGDANKVIETVNRRTAKKEKFAELDTKYAGQIAQLEADGVQVKNKRVLARLLEKSNGDINVVKQRINERKEKHQQRKEYRRKHRGKSPLASTEEGQEATSVSRKRRELSADDLENLKRLRIAGVHGNPGKILALFHECNDSVEMTVARNQEDRDRRLRTRNERLTKRTLLAEVQNSYITLNTREDWPENIEHVYLDGNNMMFVVDSLRRLCLNRAGKKTERALGEIAAAWNERMHIPNVDLVFDSTRQLEQIGTVKVSSAQPKYPTTDDMLVEIARQPANQAKNKRTIIVTSDRALAALLQREGCLLVKPYSWFAHCVMTLTPDLINYEEITGTATTASTPTTVKVRYNFDELVHRIASIDL